MTRASNVGMIGYGFMAAAHSTSDSGRELLPRGRARPVIALARRLIDVACMVMARFADGSLGRFEFEHPYTWTTGESRA